LPRLYHFKIVPGVLGDIVDIWSLGVSVSECVYGFPAAGNLVGIPWCRKVANNLKTILARHPDPLKQCLVEYMVIEQPERRASAQECHEQVLLALANFPGDAPTPAPSSFSQGYAADVDTEDAKTVVPGDAHTVAANTIVAPWSRAASGEETAVSARSPPPGPAPTEESFYVTVLEGPVHSSGHPSVPRSARASREEEQGEDGSDDEAEMAAMLLCRLRQGA
jgi:hypothetical protein